MRRKNINILLFFVMFLLFITCICGCESKTDSLPMVVLNQDNGFGSPITPQVIVPSMPDDSNSDNTDKDTTWIPDIFDLDDPYIPGQYDDSTKYDYSSEKVQFITVSGSFQQTQGSGKYPDYTVSSSNSLAVCGEKTPFPYGTFSCDVKTVKGADSGIVFGLSAEKNTFWENDTSYYIFLLSADGNVYLGKIDDGKWSVLQRKSYSFNVEDFFTLKVVYKNNKIFCFINNTLLIEHKEKNPLTGTRFGIRGGGVGAVFANISITNEYIV